MSDPRCEMCGGWYTHTAQCPSHCDGSYECVAVTHVPGCFRHHSPPEDVEYHVRMAHGHAQAAQSLAYDKQPQGLLTRLAINRAQNTLIKLLVNKRIK